MNASEGRLDAIKSLFAHARERLGLDVGFILWDGSTIPADLMPGAVSIKIADEGVIAALLRRPKLETLANLWVTGRMDIQNGSIFDLGHMRPRVRTRNFLNTVDKRLLLRTLLKFLFVPRGGPWPLEQIPRDRPSDGSPEKNKENIGYHYDVSNAFYALWLDRDMVYTCAYFTDWANDIDRAQQDKLEMICRKLRLKPGETLLDIGCGWGALSCYAAQHYGVQAYAVTLSEQQVAYGRENI